MKTAYLVKLSKCVQMRRSVAPSTIFNFKAVLHIYCSISARSSARPKTAAPRAKFGVVRAWILPVR